eukprot:c27128_g2_i1 orf=275-1996(+)
MMDSESEQPSEQARLYTPADAMVSLLLDHSPPHGYGSNNYRTVMPESISLDDAHPFSSCKHDPLQQNYRNSFGKSFQDSRMLGTDDPLVEPPSYADVIFNPYAGGAVGNGDSREKCISSSPLPSSSSSSELLHVTVTQPQKVQEDVNSFVPGSGSYVTYQIVTRTNIPEYGGTDFSVRRRFRDVVTLGDRLAEIYRGYFIPPRPDKSIVESQVMQKQEFIEQRRIALEKYFRRLSAHPVLRKSKELRLFLQSQGKLPLAPTNDMASRMLDGALNLPRQLFGEGSTTITPQDVAQPAKGGRDLVRMFKELKQSVRNDWGGSRPAIVEEDKDFLEKKDKLEDLERQLSDASQQAEALVKAQQEMGETVGELGLALIKLGKFETEEAMLNTQRTHAADAKRVATAAVKASRFYREANAQSVKHLDQLHEYLGLMQAVHAAFTDRSNALLTVQTLMSELSSLNTKVERLVAASSKIFGGDKTRNRKEEELRQAVKTTEDARDCAIKEYERIKENNRAEIERFECEREHDFLEMLKGFVHNQVGYAEKIANVWEKVAEESNFYTRAPESPIFSSPRIA